MNKEELFNENLKLVPYTMKNLLHLSINEFDFEDIMQEGYIGLWKAIQTFDESKGFEFSSYACSCIRNHLIAYLNSNGRKTARKLYEEGRSLNSTISTGEEGVPFENFIEDVKHKRDLELWASIDKFIHDKEACSDSCAIIFAAFVKGHTIKEISDKYNLSAHTVSSQLWRAKKKFKEYIEWEE